ncbi:MAG: thioesterase [candidate division KSB1 bacterium]|nr:thioesterase [candidate division KSB1 bacterium]
MKFDVDHFNPYFTLNHTISSYDVDVDKKLAIPQIFSLFQEIAYRHVVQTPWSWKALQNQGIAWVLSKIRIHIKQLPVWNDRITIKTWPIGADGLNAYRRFSLTDSEGRELLNADSSWLIIDVQNRRLQRINKEEFMAIVPEEAVAIKRIAKIPAPSALKIYDTRYVRLNDMDMNSHVNNASYVEWALDTIPMDFYKLHTITSVDVDFLREVEYGEKVDIIGDDEIKCVRCSGQDKDMCRVRFQWAPLKSTDTTQKAG